MTTISDKDRADAQAMAETLAHMLEARDNARAEVERLTAIVNSDVFEATRGGVAELRRLAEGADDEYWYSDDELRSYIDHDKANVDVPFILAASPDVVLSLLDRLAHMAEARDNARAEVERLTALIAEVRDAMEDESNLDGWVGNYVRTSTIRRILDGADS